MSDHFWAALLVSGVLTFLMRAFFLASEKPPKTPPGLAAAMDFVPFSVLAALTFREFWRAENPGAAAISGLVALLLAFGFGKDLLTIGGGLVCYWLLTRLGFSPF